MSRAEKFLEDDIGLLADYDPEKDYVLYIFDRKNPAEYGIRLSEGLNKSLNDVDRHALLSNWTLMSYMVQVKTTGLGKDVGVSPILFLVYFFFFLRG